ncbi:MAG: ester cyclase [Ectothiorhodospiraceae bacterium AqS1]|nr:ester cyclase [Ectothiorhodospiraceae bacterium AqS1]
MDRIDDSDRGAIAPWRKAMYDFELDKARAALQRMMAPDALVRISHPLGDFQGADAFFEACYAPLARAWPDLERREHIVIVGSSVHRDLWIGCAGYYSGLFLEPWLDIPPTGHLARMRFHEFFRVVEGKVVEIQAVWDIPEVMMQANAWPMAPSLGLEWHVPGPATQDGIVDGPRSDDRSKASLDIVMEMLECMNRHPGQGGPEVMEMERFWHPKMNWYGPSGIGSARGIEGFRNWHQIPFLKAMPDRETFLEQIGCHFFADGDYVGVTGWPNMVQTLEGDGWMGIAPAGKRITLRSLDFWRIEAGLIRENWVLVDILDVYRQLGVDVLARMREFNKARRAWTSDPAQGAAR